MKSQYNTQRDKDALHKKLEFVACLRRQGYTYKQIGVRLGVGIERVRQLCARAARAEADSTALIEIDFEIIEQKLRDIVNQRERVR